MFMLSHYIERGHFFKIIFGYASKHQTYIVTHIYIVGVSYSFQIFVNTYICLYSLHFVTFRYISLHFVTIGYISLHFVTFRYMCNTHIYSRCFVFFSDLCRYIHSLHFVTFRYSWLHFVTFRYSWLHFITFRYISLHVIRFH